MNFLLFLLLTIMSFVSAKSTEDTFDMNIVTTKKDAQLVELIGINPTIKLDVRYATTNNFTNIVLYPSSRVYVHKDIAHALDAVQKELLPMNLSLKIYDGYRPHSVQKHLWATVPDETYVANPYTTGSRHSRGSAVDCTLVDLTTNEELPMPSAFDDFTIKAFRNYAAMNNSTEQRNCKLLELIMVKYGFRPNPREWWHFDFIGGHTYPLLDISFEELALQ